MTRRWPDKYIVGLTGNIATGKSAVLQMAAERGALILDADHIVHEILDGDPFVQEAVGTLFGPKSQLPDGRIDRAAVGSIVFNDPQALAKLENIVHPVVRRRLFKQIEDSPDQVVFIEAIKLLEGGLVAECQEIWVTRCSRETQIERLVTFREMDRALAITRVNAQSSQATKVAQADIVIDTSGSLSDTLAYFNLAWLGLQERMGLEFADVSDNGSASAESSQPDDDSVPAAEPEPVQIINPANNPAQIALELDPAFDGIDIRRAQLSDVDQVAQLIAKATDGAIELEPSELLLSLSERGYLIAQHDEEFVAVAGWSAENLVATIDQFFIHPLSAAGTYGGALLKEIIRTANELICEVILAFPMAEDPDEIHHLLVEWGFSYVDSVSLPKNWQTTVSELSSENSLVMIKILRDTRQTQIRYLKRVQALRSP